MRVFLCALAMVSSGYAQNARDIIVRSLRVDNQNAQLTSRYTYRQRAVEKEFDGSGALKSTKTTTEEVLFLGGKQYEHLIEKEDKPLPTAEKAKEDKKFNQATAEASKLSEQARNERLAKYQQEQQRDRERLQHVPEAYNFKLLPAESVNGRPCYVIAADPKREYRGKFSNLFRNLRGTLWIDQADFEWVRLDAEAIDDIAFGLFLAKLGKGARIKFEQTRVNDEIWLPKHFEIRANARALVKRFHFDVEVFFSDYRKYQTDSRIVGEAQTN